MAVFLSTLKWSLVVGAAAALLALARPRLERRYSARWRYWAWLLMALALLLAPLPRWAAELRPPVVIEVPRVQTTLGENTGFRFQGQRPGETDQPPLVADREIRLDDIPTREELQSAYRGRGVSVDTDTLLPILWAVGAGLFALYHLVGTMWFGRKARRWSRPAGEATRVVFDAVAAEMGLERVPKLAVSAAVDSPMVLGLIRPRLLLPDEENTAEELRFILRHELTHYRRRDLWYQLLLLGANALHWFNPLVYLLRRAAAADLELTCDDAVVAGAGEAERRAYSETLLRSLHRQSALGRAALSTHFYGGARVMKARFKNILSGGGRKWGGLVLAAVLILTAAVACSFGFKSREPARDLTAEERLAWEEKLNSPEWNQYAAPYGYGDIRSYPPSMQLWNYLTENGWPEDWARETPPPAEELAKAYPPVGTVMFVTSKQVDRFLLEHTGYALADYPNGFGPGKWEYLAEYDGYLGRLPSEGNGIAEMRVLSGTVDGDTVTLEVERRNKADGRSANLARTLTLVDGKVGHYTSDLETQVRELIGTAMEEELRTVTSGGAKILNRYPTGIASADVNGYAVGDRTYTVWQCQFWAEVDDPANLPDGLWIAAEMGNWLTMAKRPAFIVSQDTAGEMKLEEVLPWEQWRDMDELAWAAHFAARSILLEDRPVPLVDAELEVWQEKLGDTGYDDLLPRFCAAAEREARELLAENVRSLESGGAKIVDSYISRLRLVDAVREGEKVYTRWSLAYRMKPEDMDKVPFAGGMSEENGWVTETSSMGSPMLLFSVDEKGNMALEERGYAYETDWREDGYTWEEYIACRYGLGMELSYKLDGWPECSTPFVTELLEGKNPWAGDRDKVALACLRELGKEPKEGSIAVLRSFDQPKNGDADEGLLLQVDCQDGPATLLMFHIVYPVESWNGVAEYWQVNSVLWPDGSSQSMGLRDAGRIYRTEYTLCEGKTAALNVYGVQNPDGTLGANHVEIIWKDGDPKGLWGGRNFFIRDAIVAEEGADSTRYYTRVWDADHGLLLEDVNFDGYTDIGVLDRDAAGDLCYLVWIYDPDTDKLTETYRYSGSFPYDMEIDPAAGELSWLVLPTDSGVYDREFYRWESGKLVLDRREPSNTIHLGTATVLDPEA